MLDHRSCTRSFSSREIKAWLQSWTRDSKPSSLFQALGQIVKACSGRAGSRKKIGEGALSYFFLPDPVRPGRPAPAFLIVPTDCEPGTG